MPTSTAPTPTTRSSPSTPRSPTATSPVASRPAARARRPGWRDRSPQAAVARVGSFRRRRVDHQRSHPRQYFPNKVHQLVNDRSRSSSSTAPTTCSSASTVVAPPAGAVRLGVARSLRVDAGSTPALKAGFLTRDARVRSGRGWSEEARKAPQYSKRDRGGPFGPQRANGGTPLRVPPLPSLFAHPGQPQGMHRAPPR